MDRRTLILSGLVSLAAAGAAQAQTQTQTQGQTQPQPLPPPQPQAQPLPQAARPGSAEAPPTPGLELSPSYPAATSAQTYSREEIVNKVSDFMGVTAESAGAIVEKVFGQKGRPTAYIAGEEGSGAFGVGLRYGRGLLYMKDRPPMPVFWQGPSVGWDIGGNASRVFTLCYDLQIPEAIYQRFPGVEGTAYFIGGLGVNYQAANGITLAPIRAGLGFRLGANAGYLAYSRKRNILPF